MYPNAPFRGNPDGGFPMYEHHGVGPLGWTLFALELVAIAGIAWLLLTVFLGRFGRRPAAVAATPATAPDTAPLETLNLRYARGEIDRDAYLQARSDLGAEPPSEQPTQS